MHLLLRAAEARDAQHWRQLATLAAWLLAPWSKKKMTPDRLLGRARTPSLLRPYTWERPSNWPSPS